MICLSKKRQKTDSIWSSFEFLDTKIYFQTAVCRLEPTGVDFAWGTRVPGAGGGIIFLAKADLS